MPVANAAPTHVPTMAASDATLVVMTAPSETETVVMSGGTVSEGALSPSGIADAAQTEALSINERWRWQQHQRPCQTFFQALTA